MNNNNTYCQGNKERNKGGKEKPNNIVKKKTVLRARPK